MFYSCRSKAPIEELGRRLDDHGRRACLAWDACLQFLSTDVQAGPEISILAENDLERTFPKGLGHQVWGAFLGLNPDNSMGGPHTAFAGRWGWEPFRHDGSLTLTRPY